MPLFFVFSASWWFCLVLRGSSLAVGEAIGQTVGSLSVLERVGAVRADRELELEEQLVGRRAVAVCRAPVLTSQLAELARPVRHEQRLAGVGHGRVVGPIRAIETDAREPAPRELIIPGHVVAEGSLRSGRLFAITPDNLAARDERAVDRTLQRLPPQRGVDAEEPRREPAQIHAVHDPGRVVPA